MIRGIGLDLVQAARMEKLSPAAVSRIFTDAELEHAGKNGAKRRAESLAGIFAAKEALAKAAGLPLLTLIRQAELRYKASGEPYIALSGPSAEALRDARILVSITHDGGTAAAVVVVEE